MVGGAVPGGIEEFFAAQAAYFARQQGPPDPERIAADPGLHGLIVGPPMEVVAAPASRAPAAARDGQRQGRGSQHHRQ